MNKKSLINHVAVKSSQVKKICVPLLQIIHSKDDYYDQVQLKLQRINE
jgi:hypothetical protein